MTDRERLIKLKINFVENFDCGDCKPSNNKCRKCLSEKEADYLLANGVIVQPETGIGDVSDGYHTFKWNYDSWQNYCGHCDADMRGTEKRSADV